MRLFSSERIIRVMDRLGHRKGMVIQHSMITKSIERAQKKDEENNFGIREAFCWNMTDGDEFPAYSDLQTTSSGFVRRTYRCGCSK